MSKQNYPMSDRAPLFNRPLASLITFLLLLVRLSAVGKPIASKKILILSQAESPSNTYLKEVYEAQGHKVVIILLQPSTQLDERRGMLITNKTGYLIKDFDLAYFRTWGQEAARDLAHTWQPILERLGVPCVDPLQAKLYNHNKHTMMRLFQENKVPMPHTVIINKGTSIDVCIKTIKEHFTDLVVIKGEGSGGKNIHFIKVVDEAQLRSVLLKKYAVNKQIGPTPLVLQQYVPSKNQAGYTYHYRIIVVGDEIAVTKCYTASKRNILASNRSLGATKEIVSADVIFSAEQQKEIKRACKLTGTNVAGVDATVNQEKLYIFEVNNSPGLAREEAEKIAPYTIRYLARQQ